MFPRPRLVSLCKISHCSCLSFYIAQVLAQYVLLWRAFAAFPSITASIFTVLDRCKKSGNHSHKNSNKQASKQAAAFMQEKHPLETSKRALDAVRCPSFVTPPLSVGRVPQRERGGEGCWEREYSRLDHGLERIAALPQREPIHEVARHLGRPLIQLEKPRIVTEAPRVTHLQGVLHHFVRLL